MRLTKKTVILAIALMCILCTAVFGTIAYLTDTDEVTNSFTIGKVEIDVDETKVNEAGDPIQKTDENGTPVVDEQGNPVYERTEDTDGAVEGNTYPMIPGKTYVKDPTMTVKEGSEPSFYRMKVTVTQLAALKEVFASQDGFKLSAIVNGLDTANWALHGYQSDEAQDTITYEFRYIGQPGEGEWKLPALFTELVIPGFFDNDDVTALKDMTINVVGNAIQQTGFVEDTANNLTIEDVAWNAFDAQMTAKAEQE